MEEAVVPGPFVIQENKCGNFALSAETTETIFQTIGITNIVTGDVSIYNDSSSGGVVSVTINGGDPIDVPPGNTQGFEVAALDTVELEADANVVSKSL